MSIHLIQRLKKTNKGFTLIELIVVIAILGILAAIAVPKFAGLQDSSKLKADSATAQSIINSARQQEIIRNDGAATMDKNLAATNWNDNFMVWPNPQSGGTFVLAGGLGEKYSVTWTPSMVNNISPQTVSEP